MNNPDKPLEASDNLHESLEATSEINEDNRNFVNKDNFADLWTEDEDSESVTEFVTADSQDIDDPLPFLAEIPEMSSAKTPKRDFDLELDDLDFRNPPKVENPSSQELETKSTNNDNDQPSYLENSQQPALDDSELELADFELDNLVELDSSIEEPSGDNSLDNSLEDIELNLDLDNFQQPALDDSELELADFELDNLVELDSSIEEPSGDNSLEDIELNLDLDNFQQPALDDSELELADFELDNLVGLDSLIEEPSGDNSLNNLDNIVESETESLDSLILESTIDVEEPKFASVEPIAKSSEPDSSNKGNVFDQTMRVSVRQLDNLNNLIGELVVKRNRLEDDQERLRRFLDNLLGHVQSLGDAGARMHDLYERSLLEGALMASRQSRIASASQSRPSFLDAEEKPQEEGLDALEMDRFNGFHLLSQDIIELIVRVREAASDIQFVVDETDKVAQTFRQVTSQLQDGMNSSRMVAFGQTADRLPRAIRDISRKQKKQTELQVEGKNVLIDKMIVEHLYNPMTHLVNNAISHGIEKPEERIKKGKPPSGNIKIHAFIQGNQTVITVSDDGAGINPEIVKAKAVEKNLITWATAQNLSEQQIYELLFHPGFSTKDEADDFAGRGVGMDVVNTDLKKIRGSISTESELGKGTTFTIRLPLVLSICKALTCVDNHTKVAFPIDGVEDTKEYIPSDIQTNANGVRCISWRNKLLPLRPLNTLLSYNRQIRRAGIYNSNQNNDDTVSVIILRSLDNLLAVEVDEVKAEQEIVIKQIDGPIPKPPGIAGATVLGDGTIMPIGDVLELIEIAQGKRTIEIGFNILGGDSASKQLESENIKQEPMVLVVDDSITVRELLSLSFTKLGYRVEQARDGQEAWDKLRGGLVCDMIFSDIEMPRMNGLELLSNLQKHEELKLIPVAMLTSRGADKHRKIANDLGAKAYLTKPYTEKTLMDVAQHLIEVNRANKEAESKSLKQNQLNSRKPESEIKDAPLVLIIDDSVTVRELLSMTFKKAGYRVEQARDGQEAWNKLSGGLNCDLAFCDIEMPRMNGLELLSQLQKDEKLSSLPIAMLTSRGAQKMRNIAAKRGANGYFVKPYVEDDLLEAARRMMNGEMLIENIDEDNFGD
jgi:chemotaxis protein histidine kinase CheA/DNA-binding response OmpR family regulator